MFSGVPFTDAWRVLLRYPVIHPVRAITNPIGDNIGPPNKAAVAAAAAAAAASSAAPKTIVGRVPPPGHEACGYIGATCWID